MINYVCPGETWAVSMSYMEVYNEQVCDLLEPVNKNLPLREDPDRGVVIVAGLSDYKVTSYDEVLELLMRGQVNRKTEATKANIVSSRSHAILQFTVVHTKRAGASSNSIIESKLSLIDLAGSERASATQNSGVRLQESANINKSLLALANCINALSERSSAPSCTPRKGGKKANFNVKYRDSKLTHLLKGSLEGNCNLVMIANVNPADSTHDDTYRTLNYANRAKNMKVKPTTKEVGAETTLAERELRLKEENEELRIRLAKLEENAQHAADSEQQLLQALAQALDALNTAKSQPQPSLPISPVRSTSKLASPTIKKAAVSPVPLPPHNKKKKKRDSSISNLSCSPGPCGKSQGEGKYHTRSSTGSIVYGLDGEDYDCDDNEEDNRDLEYEDEEDEQELENMGGLKSRRTSLDSSPRGGGGGRSSDASVQSRVGSGNSSGLNGRAGAKTAARTSSGSIEGSKPGRLSNELVKKYEVLANVTQAANRADGNLHNTSASATSTSVNDKPARPSFGKISIDPRFEYGHGPAAPSSPPRGFLSRFLCGINKKR